MVPEPGSSSNQVLKSHTEAGDLALKLDQQAKHDSNGPGQGMVPGLELHPVPKIDDSQSKSEATIPCFELHPDAKHEDDKTITDCALSDLPLSSKPKHDNDKPMEETVSGFSCSSSASSLSSSGSLKKPHSEERGPLDDSFSESVSSESPRSESLSSPGVSDEAQHWSMISVSPRSGAGNFSTEMLPPTAEWNMFGSSPMKPPPSQTMGRPTGYDPNRIPSSIFSTRPTTPMEWSTTSNESLFSIHMGNNSFSRDHVILLGDTKHEEWCNSPLHATNLAEVKSNESSNFTSNLPPVFEIASKDDKKNIATRVDSQPEKELPLATQEIPTETSEECDEEKPAVGAHKGCLSVTSFNSSEGRRLSSAEGACHSTGAPRDSNESANSCGSFAFPLLVEGGTSGSLKTMSPKPKEETLPPPPQEETEATAKHAKSNWFSWITCWPRCCG